MPSLSERDTDRQASARIFVSDKDLPPNNPYPRSSTDFKGATDYYTTCADRTVTSLVGFHVDTQKFAIEVDVIGGKNYLVELFIDGSATAAQTAELTTDRDDPVSRLLLTTTMPCLAQGSARTTFHLSHLNLTPLHSLGHFSQQNSATGGLGSLYVKISVPQEITTHQKSRDRPIATSQTTFTPSNWNVLTGSGSVVNNFAIPPATHTLNEGQPRRNNRPIEQYRVSHASSRLDNSNRWREWGSFCFVYRHADLLFHSRVLPAPSSDVERYFVLPQLETVPFSAPRPVLIDPTPPHLRPYMRLNPTSSATTPSQGHNGNLTIEAYLQEVQQQQLRSMHLQAPAPSMTYANPGMRSVSCPAQEMFPYHPNAMVPTYPSVPNGFLAMPMQRPLPVLPQPNNAFPHHVEQVRRIPTPVAVNAGYGPPPYGSRPASRNCINPRDQTLVSGQRAYNSAIRALRSTSVPRGNPDRDASKRATFRSLQEHSARLERVAGGYDSDAGRETDRNDVEATVAHPAHHEEGEDDTLRSDKTSGETGERSGKRRRISYQERDDEMI